MLSEKDIIELYKEKGIFSGNELYLKLRESADFIKTCSDNNFAVVGIEGVYFEGEKSIPDMNIIADYSSATKDDWHSFKEQCNESALALIHSTDPKKKVHLNFLVLKKPIAFLVN
jgi:hypothetical protein